MSNPSDSRCAILDLSDEFGASRILEDLVRFLPSDDCSEFVDHLFRIWELDSFEVEE